MIGENFVFCTFEILIYHYEWHITQKLWFFGFFPEVAGNIQSCMTRNALPCLWQEFFHLLIIQPKKKASDLWEWSLDQDLKSNGQSILSNEWQELKNWFLSFFFSTDIFYMDKKRDVNCFHQKPFICEKNRNIGFWGWSLKLA